MLPMNNQMVHQYPNYNHPPVVSLSPDSTLKGHYGQYVYSQYPSAPAHYPHSPTFMHDHEYFKTPSHPQSQLPPSIPMYSQHVGAPGQTNQHAVLNSQSSTLQHSNSSHGFNSSHHSYNVVPVNSGAVSSHVSHSSHVSSHSPMKKNTSSSSIHASNPQSSSTPDSSPVKSTMYSQQSQPMSGSPNLMSPSGDAPFTEVLNRRQSRKTKARDHSISSISSVGSNETVTSKRAKGPTKKLFKEAVKTKTSNRILLSNRFAPLGIKNTGNDESQIEDDDIEAAQPKVKIPPIFVSKSSVTVGQLLSLLKSVNNDFSLKDSKDFLCIESNTIDAYRAFGPLLDSKSLEYHSYRLPVDKTIDVVLKHVPTDFQDSEIEAELKALGFGDFKLMRVWDKDKKAIPVVSLYLKSNVKNKEIYLLDRLLNCVIQVEPKRRSRNIPQCINCQRFGHTKNYCKLAPRCMFCTGSHVSAECDKMQSEENVKVCVNCGENHSANYRGCQYYAELKKKRFKNQRPPPTNTPHYSNNPPTFRESDFPQHPRMQPFSQNPMPATWLGDHSYANPTYEAPLVHMQPSWPRITNPLPESTSLPQGSGDSSSPLMDSLLETVLTALKPLFAELMNKIKPMLQNFIIQLLNGSR